MTGRTERWSMTPRAAAGFSAIPAMLAILALVRPEWRTTPLLIVVVVQSIVAGVTILPATLPIEVKAMLLTVDCAALLALAVVLDLFGLRAARSDLAAAVPVDVPAPAPHRAATPTITALGGGESAAIGTAIERRVDAAGPADAAAPEVTAEVTTIGGASPGYRMVWTLRRGGGRRWCGQATVHAAERAVAADQFAAMILRARRIPPREALRCE